MFIGKPPFRTADFKSDELYKMIVEHRFAEFWRIWDEQYLEPNGINLSHELKQIFMSMICASPCHRLSIQELRYHYWLESVKPKVNV